MKEVLLRRVMNADKPEWLRLRQALWPEHSAEEFALQSVEILGDPTQAVFVLERPGGGLGGFLEAGMRKYAEGCETSPVGYLEGWYVDEDLRGQGSGAALVQAAEDWARAQKLSEMASDTWLENTTSIAIHRKLGYREAERLVHFAKRL
jgi:aminoglycoside 6'-N-acetyltransferase I